MANDPAEDAYIEDVLALIDRTVDDACEQNNQIQIEGHEDYLLFTADELGELLLDFAGNFSDLDVEPTTPERPTLDDVQMGTKH